MGKARKRKRGRGSGAGSVANLMKRAVELHRAGKLEKARDIYAAILRKNPRHADALHLSGVIAHQKGNHDAAIDLISRAIAIDPSQAPYQINLGNALMKRNRLENAIETFEKALGMDPDSVEAWYNLGNAFQAAGKADEAVPCYQKALALAPDFPGIYTNLGHAWSALERFEDAAWSYQRVIDMRPDQPEAHLDLGEALKELGRLEDAAECYEKAIRLDPGQPKAHFNMGNLLHEQERLGEAAGCFQKAIQLDPGYVDAYDNLAKTFRDMGMPDKALAYYEKSLRLAPGRPDTTFDLATLHLLMGNYAAGWAGYEARFSKNGWKKVYPYRLQTPRWDGSSFQGKRLLVHSEQGLGDCMQFARYLPMVKERGGEVIFETLGPLMNLFRDLDGVDILVEGPSESAQAMECDLHVPLLSLPGIFETRIDTVPAPVPYLFADPGKAKYWSDRFPGTGHRVGLVWTGKATDRRRSCPLSELLPLLQVPGVEFIGLQKGPAAQDVSFLPGQAAFQNVGDELNDFSDTAAVIENLDLVITIDTSVAHLAGGMGKPVWVLLPGSPDWRWLMHRDDSPWYPTMRLFRQSAPGNWTDVIDRVKRDLNAIVKDR